MENKLETTTDLLPCPFCGAEPRIDKVDALMDSHRWTIGCMGNDCISEMGFEITYQRQKDAAEAWNRRARPARALSNDGVKQLGGVNGSASADVMHMISEARGRADVCAHYGQHNYARIHEAYARELAELHATINRTETTPN